MNKLHIIFTIFFALTLQAQTTSNENRMLHTIFKVINAKSHTEIPLAIIEISVGNKKIGEVQTDFDGLSPWNICSKKMGGNKIKIKVLGMNYKPFEETYSLKKDTILAIKLESETIKFKNRGEWETFIRKELGIPFCGTGLEIDTEIEAMENGMYQHCDGRMKRFNDIPVNELYQWEKVAK
ncbi:hypothetical protein [uncultured Aquimarina sp.]|uniref:hypothetical protein n=1 Tax=uncultured Aquimarina sp. TaxID=575652 RepID=UPI0026058408|nr:hypothetical protein [uncultured Aquimarina sp.]